MKQNRFFNRSFSVLLALSLLVGSMLCSPFRASALYYEQGQKLSRAITDEGLVLLKNENAALPVAPGTATARKRRWAILPTK